MMTIVDLILSVQMKKLIEFSQIDVVFKTLYHIVIPTGKQIGMNIRDDKCYYTRSKSCWGLIGILCGYGLIDNIVGNEWPISL